MSKAYFKILSTVSDKMLTSEFSKVNLGKFKEAIKLALKEQDRDTRHACAEAVLKCEEDVSGECIWKNDAHNACMNCRGGLDDEK